MIEFSPFHLDLAGAARTFASLERRSGLSELSNIIMWSICQLHLIEEGSKEWRQEDTSIEDCKN